MEFIIIILTSTVVAAVIANFTALHTSDRKISIENITQQRQIWRDKIRQKSLEVINAIDTEDSKKLLGLYTEFSLLLNPDDNMDKEILDALWAIKDLDFSEKKRIEFTERIALLLKFEWQRAKIEARPYCKKEDARIQYSQFDNKRFPPE